MTTPDFYLIILLIAKVKFMFKRFFSTSSEIEKTFDECQVDKTHEMVHPKKIVDLAERYFREDVKDKRVNIHINLANVVSKEINININSQGNQKASKKQEVMKILLKKIRSQNEIIRIKALVVAHHIIKKIHNSDLLQILLEEVDKYIIEEVNTDRRQMTEPEIQVYLDNGRSQFIKKNIISFYCRYLKKVLLNFQTVNFIQRYCNGDKPQNVTTIQLINNGFVILNLVNYILQSQYTFNKMGRYYIDHKQILNLFIIYLNDIIVYNDYIKLITNLSVKSIGASNKEQLSHYFLFITEAQKTSDRLYEFFYNRYYYKQVKTLIEMPKFLTIQTEQFQKLVNHVKKRDKELVVMVKKSKYESSNNGRSKSCYSKSVRSQSSQKSEFNKSQCLQATSLSESKVLQYFPEEKKRKHSQTASKSRPEKRSLSAYKD